ncbi:MAG: class I SAM-dependent methyltransferase [bacterium]|nr:class I SAM-dependent methyltransferase [bacterium]
MKHLDREAMLREVLAEEEVMDLSLPELTDKLTNFEDLVLRWGKKIDLVSRGDEGEIFQRHILDSFVIALRARRLLAEGEMSGGAILDVGTGAGFPGMVLAVVFPDNDIYLCEPRAKRCIFLREAVRQLGLKSVHVCQTRLEQLELAAGSIALVTTRATGIRELYFAEAERLLCRGGLVSEMLSSSQSLPALNSNFILVEDSAYCVPGRVEERRFAVWRRA